MAIVVRGFGQENDMVIVRSTLLLIMITFVHYEIILRTNDKIVPLSLDEN